MSDTPHNTDKSVSMQKIRKKERITPALESIGFTALSGFFFVLYSFEPLAKLMFFASAPFGFAVNSF
jgi:hypothetical protein